MIIYITYLIWKAFIDSNQPVSINNNRKKLTILTAFLTDSFNLKDWEKKLNTLVETYYVLASMVYACRYNNSLIE